MDYLFYFGLDSNTSYAVKSNFVESCLVLFSGWFWCDQIMYVQCHWYFGFLINEWLCYGCARDTFFAALLWCYWLVEFEWFWLMNVLFYRVCIFCFAYSFNYIMAYRVYCIWLDLNNMSWCISDLVFSPAIWYSAWCIYVSCFVGLMLVLTWL